MKKKTLKPKPKIQRLYDTKVIRSTYPSADKIFYPIKAERADRVNNIATARALDGLELIDNGYSMSNIKDDIVVNSILYLKKLLEEFELAVIEKYGEGGSPDRRCRIVRGFVALSHVTDALNCKVIQPAVKPVPPPEVVSHAGYVCSTCGVGPFTYDGLYKHREACR